VCHPITKSAFMLLIKDAYKLHSLLYVCHLVVLDTFQKMNLKQCELCLDVCQKYLIQNKRFRDWAQSLVKNNVLPGSVLQDFETLPSGFVGLLEERIKYIKDTGDESFVDTTKSEHKSSDKDQEPKKEKKKKDKKRDHNHKDKDKEHHHHKDHESSTPKPEATPKSSGINVPEHKGDFDLFAPTAQPAVAGFDPFGPAPSQPSVVTQPASVFAPVSSSSAFAPTQTTFAPTQTAFVPTQAFVPAQAFTAAHPHSPFPAPQPTPFDVFSVNTAAPKPTPVVNAVDVFFQKPAANQPPKGPPKPRDPFAAINQPAATRGASSPFSPSTTQKDPFAEIDFLGSSQPQQPQAASLSDLASNSFFASSSATASSNKPASSSTQSNPFDPF